jgi:hypothetical protein
MQPPHPRRASPARYHPTVTPAQPRTGPENWSQSSKNPGQFARGGAGSLGRAGYQMSSGRRTVWVPPSTNSTWPVIRSVVGAARNAMTSATWPGRAWPP